ncbi:MAG: phytanoyl-CoA dioxygenase family protein [Burkholderiales bacterium]|nr:phytanoyl-CoA dioxygenase family protein [Burkholderiales bacterium]
MTRVAGAVERGVATAWLAAIDAHPAWRREGASCNDFNPHSSSLRARALAPSLDLAAVAAALLAGEVGALSRGLLGDELALNLDQCWVRRQYAPDRSPPGHAPHSWHQDGALAFDFLGAGSSEGALLAMATCWIALTPCGVDAPGLELIDRDAGSLLPLSALPDSVVRATHPERDFKRPILDPGDALVFGGGVLHHTHVAAAMRHDRTSLELRFFPAASLPPRLRGDRFLPLH